MRQPHPTHPELSYPQEDWNKFDFTLAVLAALDLVLSFLHTSFIRALRVLRAQKLLRLLLTSNMPEVRIYRNRECLCRSVMLNVLKPAVL